MKYLRKKAKFYRFFNRFLRAKTHISLIIGLLVLFSFLPTISPPIPVDATITDGMNASNVAGQYVNSAVSYTQGGINNGWDGKDGFYQPSQMAIDTTNHRLFVSDTENNRVLVFNLNSSDVLVDYTADYVLGQSNFTTFGTINNLTQSGLNSPMGLAYDNANSRLFVADADYNRVMIFDVTTITNGENAINVLGQTLYTTQTSATTQSGLHNPYGLAYDNVNSRLFVSESFLVDLETSNNRVMVFDVATITNGESAINVLGQTDFVTATSGITQSKFNRVQGLAYDSVASRLFASDAVNGRVMVFDLRTIGSLPALCGVSAAGLSNNMNASCVLGQTDFTSDSPGSLSQSQLSYPDGLVFDSTNSRLFVADRSNTRVMIFDLTAITNGENAVNVLGQTSFTSATSATSQSGLYSPTGVSYNPTSSQLFVADGGYGGNNRIMIFNAAIGTLIPDNAGANGANAVDALGQSSNGVAVYTEKGANNSSNSIGFYNPRYTAIDTTNHRLFVADSSNHRVLVFNLDTSNALADYTADYVLGQSNFTDNEYSTGGANVMSYPSGLVYDNTNNRLFVLDSNNRVMVFDVSSITNGGSAINVLGQSSLYTSNAATSQSGLSLSYSPNRAPGMVLDSTNNRLFVADSRNNRVMVFNLADGITDGESAINVLGQINFTSSGSATTQIGLNAPTGLAYDAARGYLFVADSNNYRVMVFDVAAIVDGEPAINVLGQTNFTNNSSANTNQSGLRSPMGLFYDSARSRLFVADGNGSSGSNNRVVVFDLTTIADGESAANVLGQLNFISGNSATTQSGLYNPVGVDYNASTGMVYIADSGNSRVMIFTINTPSVATAPSSISQATDGTGYVTFQTAISDIDNENTKLKVEFSDDSGTTWYDADIYSATPSSGTVDLDDAQTYQIGSVNAIDTSTGSITLTIVWDSKSLTNGKNVSAVNSSTMKLRVTPNDISTDGLVQISSAFSINNARSGGSSIINPPPSAPTNIQSASASSSATLTWSDPGDNDLAGIEIWRNNCAGGGIDQLLYTVAPGIRTYTDINNIQPSTTCLYLLISKDTSNNRTSSQEVSVAIPAIIPPPPATVCGNSLCETGETETSCPADCVVAKPNLVLTLATQIKPAIQVAATAGTASSLALALSASVLLFGAFLIHVHTGTDNGPAGFFAIFPLLFTSSDNSYMYLRKCGPNQCKGAHFTRHKVLKHFARAGFVITALAGILKLVLMAAIISFIPGSHGIQAETINAHVGDTVTVKLTVENTGAGSASNVLVKLPTPQGTTQTKLLVNNAASAADLNTGLQIAYLMPQNTAIITADYLLSDSAPTLGALSFKAQATANETTTQVFESAAATLAVSAKPVTPPTTAPPVVVPPVIPPEEIATPPVVARQTSEPVVAPSATELTTPAPNNNELTPVAVVPPSTAVESSKTEANRGSILQSIQALTSTEITQISNTFEKPINKQIKNAAKEGLIAGTIKANFDIAGLINAVSPADLIQRGFLPVVFNIQVFIPQTAKLIKIIIASDLQVFTFTPTQPIEEYNIPVNLAFGQHQATVLAVNEDGIEITLAQTTFTATLPACFDGIDNDQDGTIDEQDQGCSSREDNDEFQAPAQILSFIAPPAVTQAVEKATVAVAQTKTYQVLDKQVLNNPQVEQATITIAAPVIVAAAAANVGTAVNFASLLIYLQGFMTQPLLLFTKRKRKQWGLVYSSLTKLPVDLALVRLFSSDDNKLLQTRVTDKQGRYLFLANPGKYTIQVQKPGFIFPTSLLKDKISDFDFADLYHGGTLDVQAQSTIITPIIPVDPIEKTETPKDVLYHRRKRAVQKGVAWTGPMLAIVSVAINPTLTTTALLALQFGLLGVFKRLSQGKAPKSWGSVSDKQTGQPLAFAVARIFDAQFNKLLETQITDKQGRYAFLVGKGNFYITVEKQGYVQYKSGLLELAKEGMSEIVKQDIGLVVIAGSDPRAGV